MEARLWRTGCHYCYDARPQHTRLRYPLVQIVMPAIHEGDTFSGLKEFKSALRQWALENNWTPHILDSDSHRVRAGCRSSPDCPFRIRANYNEKRRNALVTTCDDNHNCNTFRPDGGGAHQAIKRAETGRLAFLLETVPKLLAVTAETTIHDIIEAVERKHGQRIPTRQAQKVKSGLCPRIKGPCRECHQSGHTRRHCPLITNSASRVVDDSMNTTWNESTMGDTAVDASMDMVATEEGSTGTSYIDAGLNTTGEDRMADPTNLSNLAHERPSQNSTRAQTAQMRNNNEDECNTTIDPRLDDDYHDIQMNDSHGSSYDDRLAPPQRNQFSSDKTACEVRLEASRMMHEAARLMEQAAKMNAEAARLSASVAHM